MCIYNTPTQGIVYGHQVGHGRPIAEHQRTTPTIHPVATAVVFSFVAGAPHRLPAVALGSDAVLYAERVAALMMAFVIVGVIVYRGSRGDLPSEFRGIRYANRDATNELAQKTSGATDVLADSVDDIDGRLRALETPMYRLPHRQSGHQISGYDRLEQAGGGSDNALRVVDEGTAGGEAPREDQVSIEPRTQDARSIADEIRGLRF